MPRYTPATPRVSQRDKKMATLQGMDAGPQDSGVDDMLKQLAMIYGLQQQQELAPLQQQSLAANVEAQNLANSTAAAQYNWLEPLQQQAFQQRELANAGTGIQNQRQQTAADWDPYNQGLQSRVGEGQVAAMPEQLRGMGLQNDAAAFDAQWAQPRAEQAFNTAQAQQGAIEALAAQREGLSPQIMAMVQMGLIKPEELTPLLPPEIQQQRHAQEAQANAARQAAIQQDQQQQTQAPPTPTNAGMIGTNIGNYLGEGYREAFALPTWPIRKGAAWLRTPTGQPTPSIPFTPPQGNFWSK